MAHFGLAAPLTAYAVQADTLQEEAYPLPPHLHATVQARAFTTCRLVDHHGNDFGFLTVLHEADPDEDTLSIVSDLALMLASGLDHECEAAEGA